MDCKLYSKLHMIITIIIGIISISGIKATEYEGRIFTEAENGTSVTLHPKLEMLLFLLRGCFIKVAEPVSDSEDDDSSYFVWNTNRMTLENTVFIDRSLGKPYTFRLDSFCAYSKQNSWIVNIYVSEPNKHKPKFSQSKFTFNIPRTARAGDLVGKVTASDQDEIVYNSKLYFRLLTYFGDNRFVLNEESGELRLMLDCKQLMQKSSPQSTDFLQIETCDYGSPQNCATVNVTVNRVSEISPQNLTVNSSSLAYQIVCWSKPINFSPEIYFIKAYRGNSTHPLAGSASSKTINPYYYKRDVKSTGGDRDCSIIKTTQLLAQDQKLKIGETVTIVVSTNSTDDWASSETISFQLTENVTCDGDCNNHGTPYCMNGTLKSGHFVQAAWNGNKQCECEMTYESTSCAALKKCKFVTELTERGATKWFPASVNEKVSMLCPYGDYEKPIERYCLYDISQQRPMWDIFNDFHCVTKEDIIMKMTYYKSSNFADWSNVRSLIGKMQLWVRGAINDQDVAEALLSLADKLSFSLHQSSENEQDAVYLHKLRGLVNDLARNFSINPSNRPLIQSPQINIFVQDVITDEIDDLGIGKEIRLNVPAAVVNQARENNRLNLKSTLKSSLNNPESQYRSRITIIRFNNHNFYPLDRSPVKGLPTFEIFLRGIKPQQELQEKVTFSFNMKTYLQNINSVEFSRRNYLCAFWNEKESKWSKKGVTTTKRFMGNNEFAIVCETSHLTGFTILLDFDQRIEMDEEHRFLMNLLSWIGCACSIFGLLLTIITYSVFRYLNREKSAQILLNLCISMLLMNLIFLASSARPYTNYAQKFCMLIGVTLHYFTLTTLMWMGVEAMNMYRMLVCVFSTSERWFLIKRCLFAWGLPLILIGATFVLGSDNYYNENDKYCRLSPTNTFIHYMAFLGPACLILVSNCVVFAFVLRVLSLSADTKKPISTAAANISSNRMQSTKSSNLITQIRGALTVMVLLGVTWVLGVFAVGPWRLPFMYAFCILNSAQGFVIFLARCLMYDETRQAWAMLVRQGRLKRFKGKSCYTSCRSTDLHGGGGGAAAHAATSEKEKTKTTGFDRHTLVRSRRQAQGTALNSYYPPPAKKGLPPTTRRVSTPKQSLEVPACAAAASLLVAAGGDPSAEQQRPLLASGDPVRSQAATKFIDETPQRTPDM